MIGNVMAVYQNQHSRYSYRAINIMVDVCFSFSPTKHKSRIYEKYFIKSLDFPAFYPQCTSVQPAGTPKYIKHIFFASGRVVSIL